MNRSHLADDISTGGTLGNAIRNLTDNFQLSFDPTGAEVIRYSFPPRRREGAESIAGGVDPCAFPSFEGNTDQKNFK